MKTEILCFQNGKMFKEYAVCFKPGIFAKWEFVKNEKGLLALMKFDEAQVKAEELRNK